MLILKKIFILLVCLSFLVGQPIQVYAQDQESKVIAVFLFKFFDYITWPDYKDPKKTGEGVICTLGNHPFSKSLDYIAEHKSSPDIRFKVKSIESSEEADQCNVIYISKKMFSEVKKLSRSNALLSGNFDGFIEYGGVVELKEKDGRIKLTIHLGHTKEQGLKISSRLLDIAEIRR